MAERERNGTQKWGPDSAPVTLCEQRAMTAIDQEPMFLRPAEAAALAGRPGAAALVFPATTANRAR
jgi:hypothetical protein